MMHSRKEAWSGWTVVILLQNYMYNVIIMLHSLYNTYTSRVVFPVTVEPVEGMRLDSFLSLLPRTLFCFARI